MQNCIIFEYICNQIEFNMKKHTIALLFSALFICGATNAQVARIYDSAGNLPNAQINDIYQDSEGYIWLCSHDGISRFDGTGFTTFRHGTDPESLAEDLVLKIFEDSRHTKWIGTGQGLQIYNAEINTFSQFHLYSPEPHVSDIVEFNNIANGTSRIFVSTSGRGVIVINPDTYAQDITMMENLSQSLYSMYINYLFIDSKNRLWVSSEIGGLSVVSANTCNALDNIKWDPSLAERQKSISVYSIAEDPITHNIVICTTSDGILVFDAQKQTIRRAGSVAAQKARAHAVIYNDFLNMDEEGSSFIVGLENDGIKIFDAETEELRPADFPNTPFDYSGWKVHNLTKDNQGNLWVGAFQRGILVIPNQIYGFSSTPLSVRGIAGENSGCITCMYDDEKNETVWAGCDGGGLFRLSKNGRVIFNAENSGLDNNSIMCMAMDKRGTLWIGTYLGGIFCKPAGGPITAFRENYKFPTTKVSSIAYDKKRDVIYVCFFGGGLTTIDALNQTVERVVNDDRIFWTGHLTLDNKDRLWLCSTEGLTKYDITLNELVPIESSADYMTGIVLYCCCDKDILWLGTRTGLIRYDTNTGASSCFTKENGLPSNSIYSIQKDVNGMLWLATANGLCRFDPDTHAVKSYYAYDGIQANEFRQSSTFQNNAGIMFFGGNGGITMVKPLDFTKSVTIPPVHFNRFTVMNKDVDYDPDLGKRNILDKTPDQATILRIPYKMNVLGIGFSVLEYTNPAKIHYNYKMEGFDQEWTETTQAHRHTTYTNLRPGRYTFKIRAFYEDNPSNYSEKSIAIKIKAPWYLSIWAMLAYALIIGILAYYIMRMRKSKAAAEIQDMRLNMFTNLTHEIRTPLTLVMSPLKTMRENEQNGKLKDTYNLMYRNCLRINRIVNQFMDIRKVDEGKMKLNFRETEILGFISDIMQSFTTLSQQKNITMRLDSASAQQNIWVDQGNFDKIIFNILSNAFKNTPEDGTINVNVSGPQKNTGLLASNIAEYIRIDIENSGSHIDEKDLDKIFNRFYQTSPSDASIGSGVGLNLTKMLTDLHHGRINAENTSSGVLFSLFMPCDRKHLSKEELNATSHHKDLYTTTEHPEEIAIQEHDEGKVHLAKSRKTVIFVDDDTDMLIYVQQNLKQTFNVLTFDKPQEAWDVIKTLKPDAVVTDLEMPYMRGTDLCRNIKTNADTALIPVIILTAQTDENSMQEATDVSADRVLLKPISVELLSSSILQTISNRERITARQDNSVIYEYGSIKMNSASDKLVARVMETIKQNIDNSEFSVETLCQEVGISRVHLNRRLKELVGTSPSQLIRSIRLRQAAFLLINNQVGIAEVAFKVGYSSLSHFSNSFHEYYNMSPKEFVAKYQGETDEEVLKEILK